MPQTAWTPSFTGPATFTPQLTFSEPVSGTLTFTVKQQHQLLGKGTIQLTNGSVTQSGAIPNPSVTSGTPLYLDITTRDAVLAATLTGTSIQVAHGSTDTLSAPSVLVHLPVTEFTNQTLYRGWSMFGYNANRARATVAIEETQLALPTDISPPEAFYPQNLMVHPYFPVLPPAVTQVEWRGPKDTLFVRQDAMRSARLGMDTIHLSPMASLSSEARAVNRLSDGEQASVSVGLEVAGITGFAQRGDSRSVLDFLDLNGDQFPDIVQPGHVQYTTMTGGLESSARSGPVDVRVSDNTSWSGTLGGDMLPVARPGGMGTVGAHTIVNGTKSICRRRL